MFDFSFRPRLVRLNSPPDCHVIGHCYAQVASVTATSEDDEAPSPVHDSPMRLKKKSFCRLILSSGSFWQPFFQPITVFVVDH